MKKERLSYLGLALLVIILICFGIFTVKVKGQSSKQILVDILVMENNGQNSGAYVPPPAWLVDSIKKGDKELGPSGKTNAEVVDIFDYEEGANKIAKARLKINVNELDKERGYLYKQKKLMVGSIFNFSLGKTEMLGKVTAINVNADSRKTKRMWVRLYNRKEWFANAIKTGDENEVTKIIDKKVKETEALNDKSLAPGQMVSKDNKDIDLLLDLRVEEWDGQIYFANYQPVKIGNELWIPMKNYNLYSAVVLEILNGP